MRASWGPLGTPLGFLGSFLGASWGLFQCVLGPPGGSLEASAAHRRRKGEKAKLIDFLQVWKCLASRKCRGESPGALWGFLERLLRPLEAVWNRLRPLASPSPFRRRYTRIALHKELRLRPQWARSRGGHPLTRIAPHRELSVPMRASSAAAPYPVFQLDFPILGSSWGPLGPVWAVLGASWTVLGPSGAVLGPS